MSIVSTVEHIAAAAAAAAHMIASLLVFCHISAVVSCSICLFWVL